MSAASDSGTSSTDNITNDTTPTFTWTASNGTGSAIAGYWWAIDDSTPDSGGTFTTLLTATPTVAANGNHTIYVAAVDAAGNIGTASSLLFNIDTAGTKVSDVVVRGSGWNSGVSYSYASLISQHKQLAPIYTQGVDTIKVQFTEDVRKQNNGNLDASVLKLYATGAKASGNLTEITSSSFSYNTSTYLATWTFPTLGGDRYRIDIDSILVKDLAGNALDGYWNNQTNSTLYDWSDDPNRTFLSGNGGSGTPFQFLFALNPGDYNQNGVVDAADHVVWANPTFTVDGDGDGDKDLDDRNVWVAKFANYLRLTKAQGDYNGDGTVDGRDYQMWRAAFGLTGSQPADGTSDSVVDSADYVLWRGWMDTVSAWYIPPPGLASAMALVASAAGPTVANVTISGSTSVHAAYSFDAHDGSGEQLRTVPVGGADTISITFSDDVNVMAENLHLVGLRTANLPTLADFSYDAATWTAMWRFTGLTGNSQYAISLSDAVTDKYGYRLDGEWVNPVSLTTVNSLVSEFPSGDGYAGGNFNFVMTLLWADTDLSGVVDSVDSTTVFANWLTFTGMVFTDGDSNGNGGVNSLDVGKLGINMGLDLRNISPLSDLNGDFMIDDDDMFILAGNFGMSSPTHSDGDLNGDGYIDTTDLDLMFAQYGLELAVAS